MNTRLKKPNPDGFENAPSPEIQEEKINEVRELIGPQSGKLAIYCSDASISRYLMARSWNVKKASKMLKASLKWRSEYKPEEIRWDDIAQEAETGKIYRSNYKDIHGRPVLVMRPRCQNSKSIKGQIKYLVYCMENAILDLTGSQKQMVWLIDFHGFSVSNISLNVTRETAHVLQEHYPERLGVAILYNPPKIFEPFYRVAKPFLDPKTAAKVKFVYSNDPGTTQIMYELFDLEVVETAFGGKVNADFDINKYAERMREDEKRAALFWETNGSVATILQLPTPLIPPANSDSDSDTKVSILTTAREQDDNLSVGGSQPNKSLQLQ